MSHIQTDTSDEALVIAIRANMSEFFRRLSRSNPQEYLEHEKFTRWITFLQHPWFNGMLSSTPFNATDGAFIAETIQHFRSKQIKAFTWWMDPTLQPSDLEPALTKFGFGFSKDTPGMAVDLQALNEPIETEAGLEVRVVADEESLRAWARTFVAGYGLPAELESGVFDLWWKLGLDFPVQHYLGYLNGKPVSTSSVFFGGGVAGIYNISTLPEMRGNGLGGGLTLHAVAQARQMGYRIGILQSSEMGFNLYKRLGFRHLCQIEYFYLKV